jgi:hypothetical protein
LPARYGALGGPVFHAAASNKKLVDNARAVA